MDVRALRKVCLSIGVTVALVALVWMVGGALAQGPDDGAASEGSATLAATVPEKINYQGRLTDPAGEPLDGTFPMRFQIYDSSSGPTMLWDSGPMGVNVDHGLFNVELGVDPADFDGQALWLQIYVDYELLTPRQELLPVPYALSLRPGASIKGVGPATCSAVLEVENDGGVNCGKAVQGIAATGSAVWGSSDGGWGVRGYSENNYAVYGSDGGTTQAKGYGGYFESTTGVGVYGYSSAESTVANVYAPGVYGRSANGVGVYGVGSSSSYPGYGGVFEGRIGVSARSTGSWLEDAYAGVFISEDYRGLYVKGSASWYDAYFDGDLGIYVKGSIFAGSKAGYVVEIALNDGPESLELGDVVVITGAAEPMLGNIPVPMVQKASDASSTGVIGVVDRRFVTPSNDVRTQEPEAESPGYFVDSTVSVAEGGGIARGEYVGVVTLGSFRAIKVDASYGAIQAGDLLVSSDTPGHAMKATDAQVGTVIGKALGSLDSGTGIIPVLVTLH